MLSFSVRLQHAISARIIKHKSYIIINTIGKMVHLLSVLVSTLVLLKMVEMSHGRNILMVS